MRIAVVCCLMFLATPAWAQKKAAPAKIPPPTAAELTTIAEKIDELDKAIAAMPRKTPEEDLLAADVEIFRNAAQLLVRHKEFYSKDSAAWTLDVLNRGLARAKAIAKGDLSYRDALGQTIVRGYRSDVDGTAQPYAVTYPAFKTGKSTRTDVVLHGRDGTFSEVKFIRSHSDRKSSNNPYIQIDIAGRGNNAYRWAGEADVLEALSHHVRDAQKRHGIDPSPNRIVLRGFSMGGAGTWHLGLHRPDYWCIMSPGAGFTTTHGYIAGLPNPLPPYQEACLKIYDAINYAENAAAVPVVAYSGGKDGQKKAADNIEARVKELGLSMVHLIAPDEEHRFPPEWVKKADVYWTKHAAEGRPAYPKEVHFTTYTLKYPSCDWVTIAGLGKHYEKAQVDAKKTDDGFDVKTRNVTALTLRMEPKHTGKATVRIDGETLTATLRESDTVVLTRQNDRWAVDPGRDLPFAKRQNLQGPIDDAFAGPFLCVKGTGKAWNADVQKYADADLARFEEEWSKFLRGKLRIKNDVDVTAADVKNCNLILFGDPSSNSLIAKVVKELPIRWTDKEIVMAGETVASDRHVPVLIHPNPLNKNRYVVLNSGHTFHAKEFLGTNAQLYPRLGDFAILRIPAGGGLEAEVATAGLFDEFWRFPARK